MEVEVEDRAVPVRMGQKKGLGCRYGSVSLSVESLMSATYQGVRRGWPELRWRDGVDLRAGNLPTN